MIKMMGIHETGNSLLLTLKEIIIPPYNASRNKDTGRI
jgi:hypothetical protein